MSAETTIKQELTLENVRSESAISNVKQEAVTPEKKRGRKKKCEKTNNIINEEATTTRPNRGKRVNYSLLLYDEDDAVRTPQKRKRTSQDNGGAPSTTTHQENRKKRGDATEEMMSKIFSCMNNAAAAPINFDNLIQIPEEDLPPPPPPPPQSSVVASNSSKKSKRGLFGKKRQDDEYNTTEETVTCGRCNLLMDGDSWKNHKRNFHNDLAWKLGEPPIDLNDRALVTSILAKVYKARRPLNCENCGLKKKSVLGFLSHKMQCERSQEEIVDMKVKCELCGNTMLPVSLAVHMRLSHGPKPQDPSELIVPKSTRKSAAKAQDMIHLVTNDVNEGDALKASIRRFITKKSSFLTNPQSKQKLSKEVEKYGHVKCKFNFCSVLMQNVTEAVKHMLEHYSSKKPETKLGCRACLSVFHSWEVIEEHVLKEHLQSNDNNDLNDFEVSSNGSDEEEVVTKSNPRKLAKDPRFLMRTKVTKSANILYPYAYSWTSQFYKNNYNIPNLFQNLLPHINNWQQLPEDLIETYSPEFSHSMDVAFRKTKNFINTNSQNYEWKKIELFETSVTDSIVTIFCGGPITEMCWVPTPHDENVQQILSVSITLDFNKKYHINKINCDPAVIQFWNFGMLDNQNLLGSGPVLEFCLCGDFGYVTHMEWCPSGCYDVDEGSGGLQRLGLLAVASTDSFVHVFSVPKPSQIKSKLIKPSPVLKLQIQAETDQKFAKSPYIPTKLSWTKARQHRYIAVGYSNGLVALFDLNTDFPLLKRENSLFPIKTFQPHLHCITAINLYHTSEGCRWLATGSTDRHCKFWDLTNTSTPISALKKFPVTDGVWLTHWASAIFGYDDDGSGGTPTLVYSVRDFRSEPKNLLYSSAAITAIGGTDWMNGVAQGNSAGEVIGVFPHQLMVGLENDRSLVGKKLLLSYGRMVEKTLNAADRLRNEQKRKEAARKEEESEENSDSEAEEVVQDSNASDRPLEPLDYEGAEAKYGVVFCDTDMTWGDKEDVQKLGYQSKYLLQERSDTYAAVKVTKISFNPNKQSYVYFACGYQSGFVRIASLKNLRERRL